MPIKAPYNFVPLSNEVYFPDWADQISMDIPFSDGLSGTIELQLTAESPIYVRNGHTRADKEAQNGTYKAFSNIANQYFIPATSLKGAIRNVLEIMTFSKMGRIADKRYSIRDVNLKAYTEKFNKDNVRCGWMRLEGNEVVITDHGIPRRISFKTLDSMLPDGEPFQDFATNDRNFKTKGLDKEFNRTAFKKYQLAKLHGLPLEARFGDKAANDKNKVDLRREVILSDDGTEGTIVFTGQPGHRDMIANTGKGLEFVFDKQPASDKTPIRLNIHKEGGLYDDFCFIYKDSADWKEWEKRMKAGEPVPVFFQYDNNGKLCNFGLSYMYRFPMRRVKEYLRGDHIENKLDLAECIFGYAEKTDALRGRVQFSPAFCEKEGEDEYEYAPYMGTPKPTYYPIYIEQNKKEVTTMLDKDAKLRGWKRYPVREDWNVPKPSEEIKEEHLNPFIPLGKGTTFKAKVRFHNLRPVELGALLTAIQFEGNSHSIGFAKAMGFGRTKMEITHLNGVTQDINNLIDTFKKDLNEHIKDATKSEQWKELKLMAKPQLLRNKTGNPLTYMELKEYQKGKKDALPRYSDLLDTSAIQAQYEFEEEIEATVEVLIGNQVQLKCLVNNRSHSVKLDKPKKKIKIGQTVLLKIKRKGNQILNPRFKD